MLSRSAIQVTQLILPCLRVGLPGTASDSCTSPDLPSFFVPVTPYEVALYSQQGESVSRCWAYYTSAVRYSTFNSAETLWALTSLSLDTVDASHRCLLLLVVRARSWGT